MMSLTNIHEHSPHVLWGDLVGNIKNQLDLRDLINDKKVYWGSIKGDITHQCDLMKYIDKRIKKEISSNSNTLSIKQELYDQLLKDILSEIKTRIYVDEESNKIVFDF